jgi:hypothetical protein
MLASCIGSCQEASLLRLFSARWVFCAFSACWVFSIGVVCRGLDVCDRILVAAKLLQ